MDGVYVANLPGAGAAQGRFNMIHQLTANIQSKLAIQFLNASRTGDINFGQRIANHIDTDKNQAFFP